MKPSLIEQTVSTLTDKGISVYITGMPGGGKTSVAHAVAKAKGWDGILTDMHPNPSTQTFGLIELHVPTMLVEDFGIPWMGDDVKTFSYRMPDWYPYQGKAGLPPQGILLVDDRDKGNQDIQKVLANIQQARHLHGVPLADGWQVVSTGNRVKDRAGAVQVLSHLADREVELEFDTDLDDWCRWAIKAGIHPMVVAYVRFKPDALHDFDPSRDKNATPRGWAEGISPVVGVLPPEVELAVYTGRIGEGRAVEFKAFSDMYKKLPNPDVIMLDPANHPVPTEGSVLYALSGALAARATDNNFGSIMQFGNRLPPEFQVLLVRDAIGRNPDVASTDAFTKWVTESGASVLM